MLHKKAIFVSAHSPSYPITARVLSSRWASIVSAPTACNLQVEADFQLSATNCSSFSDIKALRKCDFFDLFSLTGHHFSPHTPPTPSPTPPPPPCRFYIIARLLSSCPVCLLCPSNPPPLLSSEPPGDFFFWLSSLYHSSHSSHPPHFLSY